MQYTINTYNPNRGKWTKAAMLYDTDRHTARFIETIIRERAKADTEFIVTGGGEFVSREVTPYKGS